MKGARLNNLALYLKQENNLLKYLTSAPADVWIKHIG